MGEPRGACRCKINNHIVIRARVKCGCEPFECLFKEVSAQRSSRYVNNIIELTLVLIIKLKSIGAATTPGGCSYFFIIKIGCPLLADRETSGVIFSEQGKMNERK